jgi:hypothetical protein
MKIKINKQAILEEASGLISAAIPYATPVVVPIAKRIYTSGKISSATQAELNKLKKDESILGFKPSDSYSLSGNIKTGMAIPTASAALQFGAAGAADALSDTPESLMNTIYGTIATLNASRIAAGAGAGALTHVIGNRGGKTYQQALAERQAELNKK